MLAAQGQQVDLVLEFKVEDSLLVRRITGRWIHAASGRSYHLEFNPPKKAGFDDVTGEPLIQRSDDTEAALSKRLTVYHKQTEPILAHYQTTGILKSLDASKSVEAVWVEVQAQLNSQQPHDAPDPSWM